MDESNGSGVMTRSIHCDLDDVYNWAVRNGYQVTVHINVTDDPEHLAILTVQRGQTSLSLLKRLEILAKYPDART